MNHHSRISKMFGALVLGGGMLIQPTEAEAEPEAQEAAAKPAKRKDTEAKNQASSKKGSLTKESQTKPLGQRNTPQKTGSSKVKSALIPPPSNTICQIDFTLHTYNRDGVSESQKTTCLDDKSDAEILSIIKEAKKQTCDSPFCGCWLG